MALPIFIYYANHWSELLSRSQSVSVFNAPHLSVSKAIWKSLSTHINAFFVSGDHNPRHNYNSTPLLPSAWAVLFGLGLVISLREIYQAIKKKNQQKKRKKIPLEIIRKIKM